MHSTIFFWNSGVGIRSILWEGYWTRASGGGSGKRAFVFFFFCKLYRQSPTWVGSVPFFFVVSTITCPRTGSIHKVARRPITFFFLFENYPIVTRSTANPTSTLSKGGKKQGVDKGAGN